MSLRLKELQEEACQELEESGDLQQLEERHNLYLGRKGKLTAILKEIGSLSSEERPVVGRIANEVRSFLQKRYREILARLKEQEVERQIQDQFYDLLRPLPNARGHLHPITVIQNRVEDIFLSMGFQTLYGPEVETDENNFGKLNFSEDHPARDMQDTIWTVDGNLLRTHTSAVQVRAMQKLTPPFRIIAPGRCFRYEETDALHENTFHQVEGMMVDRDISIAHLIYVMKSFLSAIFANEIQVRLRPGYFPFVEPGFELDMHCTICRGSGCQTCGESGWIEVLPCGLVHPNVLSAGGIDPKHWSGFAFGLGLDRLAMMLYGIEDIRHFMSGNIRFLEQF